VQAATSLDGRLYCAFAPPTLPIMEPINSHNRAWGRWSLQRGVGPTEELRGSGGLATSTSKCNVPSLTSEGEVSSQRVGCRLAFGALACVPRIWAILLTQVLELVACLVPRVCGSACTSCRWSLQELIALLCFTIRTTMETGLML
jgi:hypothetical protein